MKKICPLLLLLLAASTVLFADAPNNTICIKENRGQIADQNNKSRKDILYYINTPELSIFIGNGSLHYQFTNIHDTENINLLRLDMILEGCNKNPKIEPLDMQPGFDNYYLWSCGTEGITNIRSYSKVVFKEIYPSIDWILYSKNGELKYDFIVHEDGNVSDIKMHYKGVDSMIQQPDGSIYIHTKYGYITEKKPYSYEQNSKRFVSSGYVLQDHSIHFATDDYKGALVIDPALDWLTYYGGTGDEFGMSVITDQAGFVYMTGKTTSTSFIATVGSHQSTYNGLINSNAFLVKMNSAGVRQWATYYNTEVGNAIACDNSGNVYVTGTTTANTNVATPGCHQSSYGGGKNDGYLVKFNAAGVRQWGTFYGGSDYDPTYSVKCDPSGNVYICGITVSSNGISTPGSHQSTYSGGSTLDYDAYLVKFNAAGVRQWGTYYGGNGDDDGLSLACDATGNVYMAGFSGSSNAIATTGSYKSALTGIEDMYLVKFDATGTRHWGTYYGGTGNYDRAFTVACDNSNVYIAGITTSTSGIATPGSAQSTFGGNNGDGFLIKFNSAGGLQWGTYLGGSDYDYIVSITCDANNIFATGITKSNNNIVTPGTYQGTIGGSVDCFLAQFTNTGNKKWSTYLGKTQDDIGQSINYANNTVYISGFTNSSAFSTPNTHQQTYGGGPNDAFLVKFIFDIELTVSTDDTVLCKGDNMLVSFTVKTLFSPGNIFTVQISDAFGSFASPVTIGSIAGTNSGSILCTLPGNLPPGNNYRVRILASSPGFVSDDNGVNIRIIALPVANAGSNSPICEGDTLTLHVDSIVNMKYTWTGPKGFKAIIANPFIDKTTLSNAGTYMLIYTDNICTDSIPLYAEIVPIPDTPRILGNAPICINGTLQLLGHSSTPGIKYTWNGPGGFYSFLQNPIVPNITTPGIYTLVVDTNGCFSDTAKYEVTLLPRPNVTAFTDKELICENDTVMITADGGVEYLWLPEYLVKASNANTAKYIVPFTTVISAVGLDANKCPDTAHIKIQTKDCCREQLIIPTAFTPNDDGKNDRFMIRSFNGNKLVLLEVFNRWGEMVYRTNANGNGWDGTYKGEPAEIGAYYYYCRFLCNGEQDKRLITGDVTLVR